jgi:hypothetical protein
MSPLRGKPLRGGQKATNFIPLQGKGDCGGTINSYEYQSRCTGKPLRGGQKATNFIPLQGKGSLWEVLPGNENVSIEDYYLL